MTRQSMLSSNMKKITIELANMHTTVAECRHAKAHDDMPKHMTTIPATTQRIRAVITMVVKTIAA
jgi:hypothetical protein